MKAKKLLFATFTLCLGLTLAGCDGGKKEANYIVPAEFDTTQELKLRFYNTQGDDLQKVTKEAIDAFEKDYPNVDITSTQVGSYDDVRNQITSEIANDQQPHIAYCYPDHVALYNKANAVVQLDNLIADKNFGFTKEQLDDFVPGYYAEGKQFGDDLMYTLPFSKSTEVLYYNKTEFVKNGWEVPKTWDEMFALCEVIKAKYPKSIPLGIDSEANTFITLAEQIGSGYTSATGDHFIFDNAENKAFMSVFKEKFGGTDKSKNLFTTQTILTTYTSSLFVSADEERSFMSIGSTGGASHQYSDAFECGIAAIPTWGDVPLKVISQGPSLALFQKDNPQEVLASWIFVKNYLMTTEFQAKFSMQSGYNPVLKSVSENPTYKDEFLAKADGKSKDGVKALAALQSSKMVDSYYTSPAFVGSSKARDEVGALFVAILTGTDIDEAFEHAILECED